MSHCKYSTQPDGRFIERTPSSFRKDGGRAETHSLPQRILFGYRWNNTSLSFIKASRFIAFRTSVHGGNVGGIITTGLSINFLIVPSGGEARRAAIASFRETR